MKKFNTLFVAGKTQVMVSGSCELNLVKEVHETRNWIKVDGYCGSFQRDDIIYFTNKQNITITKAEVADYCETEINSPTITLYTEDNQGNEFKWDVQTQNCKMSVGLGCLVYVDDEEYCCDENDIADSHYVEAVEYAEIFAKQSVVEQQQENIKERSNYKEIEKAAKNIKGILSSSNDVDSFLVLASVLVNAETICITDTSILLQVQLGATQEQVNQILDLF